MRKKNGQERLKIAMDLRNAALSLAKSAIKDKNPKISPRDLREKIQERIYGLSIYSKNSSAQKGKF